MTKWFLQKLLRSPATWIGLAAGIATAFPALSKIGPGGGIGFATLTGFAAGMFAFVISFMIRNAYRSLQDNKEAKSNAYRKNLVQSLLDAGFREEAEIISRIYADEKAIESSYSGDRPIVFEGDTPELVIAIVAAAESRANELLEMNRLLRDADADGIYDLEREKDEASEELRQAALAVAKTRERFFSAKSASEAHSQGPDATLSSLTERLEEENSISERVQERLHADLETGVLTEEVEPEKSAPESSELEG